MIPTIYFGQDTLLEKTLSYFFPPRLTAFSSEDMQSTHEYLGRMNRRGVEYSPSDIAGVRVVARSEGEYMLTPARTGDFIPTQTKVAVFPSPERDLDWCERLFARARRPATMIEA